MKKDAKLCWKLMKYCYHYKDENYTCVVLFVLGVISFFLGFQDSLMLGSSLFLVVMPGAFIKALFNLPYSYMVCSSKRRRMIELIFPNMWSMVATCFGYLVWILLVRGFLVNGSPEREAEVAAWIIWSSLFHLIILLFYSISTRLFWQGVLVLVPVMMVFMIVSISFDEGFMGITSFGPAAVTGFLITMAGAVLSCVLRVLVYKLPLVRGSIGKKMLTEM